jgi:predicted RNase H-like nuclease (RuvC/YqgF family)
MLGDRSCDGGGYRLEIGTSAIDGASGDTALAITSDPKSTRDREIDEIKLEIRQLEQRVDELEIENHQLEKTNTELKTTSQKLRALFAWRAALASLLQHLP